jgi:hypothetical protein
MAGDDDFRSAALDRLTEIGTALSDLASSVEEGKASRDVMLELSAGLVELVEIADGLQTGPLRDAVDGIGQKLERIAQAVQQQSQGNAAVAQAIYQGLRDMQPPQVRVGARTWRFEDVDYHPNGAIKGMTARAID